MFLHIVTYKFPARLRHQLQAAFMTFTATFAVSTGALAETSAKDVQVMMKAISFLTSKPAGKVPVAVVFDSGNPASKTEAEAIKVQLEAVTGALQPVPTVVAADQLGGFSGIAAVVATGLSPAAQDKVAQAVKGHQMLSVSADASCAKAAKCALAVQSEPKVQILLNPAATKDAGVDFAPTFRMMITEL